MSKAPILVLPKMKPGEAERIVEYVLWYADESVRLARERIDASRPLDEERLAWAMSGHQDDFRLRHRCDYTCAGRIALMYERYEESPPSGYVLGMAFGTGGNELPSFGQQLATKGGRIARHIENRIIKRGG